MKTKEFKQLNVKFCLNLEANNFEANKDQLINLVNIIHVWVTKIFMHDTHDQSLA